MDFIPDEVDGDDLVSALPIDLPDEPVSSHTYTFGDVTVHFPYEAYESQKQMMDAAIKAVNSSEHALLESPTGTGKTAALLCALLGWLENAMEPREPSPQVDNSEIEYTQEEIDSFMSAMPMDFQDSPSVNEAQTQPVTDPNVTEDWLSVVEASLRHGPPPSRCPTTTFIPKYSMTDEEGPKFPVIYYATRTHSQIKQVVGQLRKTRYASFARCAIMGSRKQFCINPSVVHEECVDSACSKLAENSRWNAKNPDKESRPTCEFYRNEREDFKLAYGSIEEPMDIEDLKAYGRKCSLCPYYGSRALAKEARVVFCTYNHLLHAGIRKAMGIELDGNIAIFDEAHNIEEICREIATLKVKLSSLDLIKAYFASLQQSSERPPPTKRDMLRNLEVAVFAISGWMRRQCEPTATGFIQSHKTPEFEEWKKEINNPLEVFSEFDFGPDNVRSLLFDNFMKLGHRRSEDEEVFNLPPKIQRALNGLLYSFYMLYQKDRTTGDYYRMKDYKIFLVKKLPSGPKKRKLDTTDIDIELFMLCLNPAITFRKMKESRTVIVTSGTLSPTASFSSELETTFGEELSAQHVLGPDRIFATAISTLDGDWNRRLEFTARHLKSHFDIVSHDLCEGILLICSTVPHGILVFAPSSSLMTRLKSHWEETGKLEEIKRLKAVFFEHENRRPAEFLRMLESYKECIESGKGAILFAILRGRVSEGIDFPDNLARAVATIGIPYSPCQEDAIVAKREYNDRKSRECTDEQVRCLNGHDWYDINAFRALNQALGRCVRHNKDWGAVIIFDSRFRFYPSRQIDYLPGWIRSSLISWNGKQPKSVTEILPKLRQFVRNNQSTAPA